MIANKLFIAEPHKHHIYGKQKETMSWFSHGYHG